MIDVAKMILAKKKIESAMKKCCFCENLNVENLSFIIN